MRFYRNLAFASVSLLSLASAPAFAQGAEPGNDSSLGEGGGDIVVTARRRDESAQDVPLVVNAVTSESLSKLNIRDFRDVETVVPGLQLTPAPNGSQSSASLRGLNNDVTAAGFNGTVQFYLNDAPISVSTLLTAMYDVGQIEVLRGPQGTLRGRAAPSGSITVTTRRPDLQEVGGYVNMTGTANGGTNINAAVGVPIVKDVLAIRFAGLFDQNSSSRIGSLNNGVNPWSRTSGERVSIRFDPIDTLSINASFSNIMRDARDYQQVESANLATGTALPAGSRLITAEDRLAVGAAPTPLHSHFKIWNWSADWRVAGQRLVYVGSHSTSAFQNTAYNDTANAFAGLPDAVRFSGQTTNTLTTEQSHELRLQSDERLFGMFDYIIGGFWYKTEPNTALNLQTPIFGGTLPSGAPDPATLLQIRSTNVLRNSDSLEKSIFFNLTAHFGERTELSAGGRYINYHANNFTIGGGLNRNDPVSDDQWIYTASLKHRFSDNFMAYASVGSSWRPGSSTNGVIDTNADPSPVERALQGAQPSETSTSYEIGFKSDFFDRRVRLNVSAFHQDFDNFIYFAPNIFVAYTDSRTAPIARQLSGLAVGVPAKVDGVEAELAIKVSDRFNLTTSATYARSRIKNGVIPCNNFGGGIPTYAAIRNANGGVGGIGGETVGTCTVNFSAARSAPFSATAQAEYMAPVNNNVEGFARGLLTFNGNSVGDPTNPYDNVDAYALLNLYTGIRSPDGDWEVSLFAKNIFNAQRVLTRNANESFAGVNINSTGLNVASGYRAITTTQPREFGLNVRFAFGSR